MKKMKNKNYILQVVFGLLFFLLPYFTQAQVNGSIQKTTSTRTIRYFNPTTGLADSMLVIQLNSLANLDMLRYNSATLKWIPRTPAQVVTDLGGTTVGTNFFTLANPSAITFPRINANNTVDALSASDFRTAIGAGTGSGTVTSVSGTTNRITSTGGTTPVIDISASYVGQSSITTLGTIGTGIWNAGAVTSTGAFKGTILTLTAVTAGSPGVDSILVKNNDNRVYKISPTYYATASAPITLSAIGASANANGATLTAAALNLEPASASFGGVVTTGAQTFAGIKTLATPVFTGLPTGTGVASAATASTLIARDASANASANSFLPGYTTTATAAGTTTLTVTSTYIQNFTGSTTQTVTLPVTSTLVAGQQFYFNNQSTGIITINSSGSNVVVQLGTGSHVLVTCILITGTTAASWYVPLINNVVTGVGSVGFTANNTQSAPGGKGVMFGTRQTDSYILFDPASSFVIYAAASKASAITGAFTSAVTALSVGATGNLTMGGTTITSGSVVMTVPVATGVLSCVGCTETLLAKTLTSPVINAGTGTSLAMTGAITTTNDAGFALVSANVAGARTISSGENTNTGTTGQARSFLQNSTSSLIFAKYSTGFTSSGIATAAGGAVYDDGAGGISIGATNGSGDLRLFSRNALAATFGASQAVTFAGVVSATNAALTTPAFTGVPTGTVTSGTYTPTATGVANVASSTPQPCQWNRIGNIVTVYGAILIDPTLATITQIRLSLPASAASNFTLTTDANGTNAAPVGVAGGVGSIVADTTNDEVVLTYFATSVTADTQYFSFGYEVK